MAPLDGWENFYVIVGSSAGALIGLQFVVITLIAGRPAREGEAQAGEAFATPSVVHFGVVLLLSAVNSAPWGEAGGASFLWGLVGFCGIAYVVVVARRMKTQDAYRPVYEDWLFHTLLPFAAYAVLAAAAFMAPPYTGPALFLVAAAALLLLFVGIHNAWDSATHLIFVEKQRRLEAEGESAGEAESRETK
ncbi:MAG: hypothetical protein JOZ96_19530 [Acidobacteria bacterium]|nr:hypothetical protein [Acidobacteriota bacterium]